MYSKMSTSFVLAAAVFAGGALAPVHAGHWAGMEADARQQAFMAHHGLPMGRLLGAHRAALGVAIVEIPQSELERMELEYGVQVGEVRPGSVADAAGVKAGDVLTSVNDRPAYSAERLRHLVAEISGEASLTVLRGGNLVQLDATFPKPGQGKAVLGVRIQEMTGELKEAFGARADTGVLISQVFAGSPAMQGGLRAGDVIVAVDDRDITSARELTGLMKAYAFGDSLDITFLREREKRSTQIELAAFSTHAGPAFSHPHEHHGAWRRGGHGYEFHGHRGMLPRTGCSSRRNLIRS